MSSKLHQTPGLRRREDENPPQMPAPVVDEQQHVRNALFGVDCPHKDMAMGRNLVVNIDGTSNQFSETSTNVVEMFSRLIKDLNQRVYYDSGIGTYARQTLSWSYVKQVMDHKIDTAIAWNFEKIVHAAYKWLSENYEPGDRIFLFGFSRGAYQVRVIAGMIEKVGLLHKGNDRQIPFAYELYSSVTGDSPREARQAHDDPEAKNASSKTADPFEDSDARSTAPEVNESTMNNQHRKKPEEQPIWSRLRAKFIHNKKGKSKARADKEHKLCAQFKRSLCHEDVKVHFVGAWDTVSSIGVFRGKSFPETVSGMTHVCHFRHALALDERRAKFQPEYVNGGLGPSKPGKGVKCGDVKEVWFAGSHSDIGGGNVSNEDLTNFGPSLRWMTYEAMACGLRIKPYLGKWLPVVPKESLVGAWIALEYFPFSALSYRDENSLTWRPHRGAPRRIQDGQLIHESVFTQQSDHSRSSELNHAIYCPKAVIHESFGYSSWHDLFAASSAAQQLFLIERDPYENAFHVLGCLAIACFALDSGSTDRAAAVKSFETNMVILQSFSSDGIETHLASLLEVPDAGGTLLTALGVAVHHQVLGSMTLELKETLIRLLSRARAVPTTARFLPVSQVYQWGSKIRRYRDDFLEVLQQFACRGNMTAPDYILGAAFLRTDPKQVVVTAHGRESQTTSILTWDGSTQPPKEIVNVRGVRSTISRDGSHIATCFMRDLSVVDITPRPPVVIKGIEEEHRDGYGGIRHLCLSDDHQTLATWRQYGSITLWRPEGDQWKVFKRFRNVIDLMDCLAFARDGSRLVASTWDGIQVWKVAGRGSSSVWLEDSDQSSSLAWSPSGDSIASGTDNGTVTIWSADQGKITHTFKAHDDRIRCLTFRDDGQVLATGGLDHRIRIWRWGTWEKMWEFDVGEAVCLLAFSPDGKQLVSGHENSAVYLWDVDTGQSEPVE
ncbi:hypothetical protein ONZ45_g5363 [Pleurotus djamor]|nr:hypothetical protein ONZ45_g5363 [Pleurotus djamor]